MADRPYLYLLYLLGPETVGTAEKRGLQNNEKKPQRLDQSREETEMRWKTQQSRAERPRSQPRERRRRIRCGTGT
jgi:hypothetical protein